MDFIVDVGDNGEDCRNGVVGGICFNDYRSAGDEVREKQSGEECRLELVESRLAFVGPIPRNSFSG